MSYNQDSLYEEIIEQYGEDTEYVLSRLEAEYNAPYSKILHDLNREREPRYIFTILDSYHDELIEKRGRVIELRGMQNRIETAILLFAIFGVFASLSFVVGDISVSPEPQILFLLLVPLIIVVLAILHAKRAIQKFLEVKNGYPR